jgi:hypothetical protein
MADHALVNDLFPRPPNIIQYPHFLTAWPPTDYEQFARQAIDMKANLIVNFGSGLGDFDKIVSRVEAGWPSGGPARPYYLSYQRSAFLAVAVAEDMPSADAGPALASYQRTLVFDQAQSESVHQAYDVFSGRFEALSRSTGPAPQMSLAHDCVYVLALGLQAARGQSSIPPEDVTGEQFRTGMGRLVGGETWGFGVGEPSALFSALALGSTVDVFGASGDLPFVVAKGHPEPEGALWCLNLEDTPHTRAVYRQTGVTFSPVTGQIRGEFSCATAW